MASFAFTDFGSSGVDSNTYADTLTVTPGGGERTFLIPFGGRRPVSGTATGITSVKVDGVTAALVTDGTLTALLLQIFTGDGSADIAGIVMISAADLPDENVGDVDIEIIFNGPMIRAGWAIGQTSDPIEALAIHVARDGEDKSAATDATLDVSLNTPANGFVVGAVFATDTTAASASFTWTGLTEPVGGDFQTGGESARFGVASASGVSAETPRAVSVLAVHAGTQFSPVAVAVSFAPAGDVTAPVLSNPAGTATGETTASLGVDTDEGNGTLSWVVTTSSTSPSGAQVAAGQDHTGAAAADSGSQAVSGTGTQSISGGAGGLTAATTYWAHFVQDDAAANRSNVATSASFTTDSAVTPPTPVDVDEGGGGGGRRRGRRYPYPNVLDDGWDWEGPDARAEPAKAEDEPETRPEPEPPPAVKSGPPRAVPQKVGLAQALKPAEAAPQQPKAAAPAQAEDRVAALEAEVESLRAQVAELKAKRLDDEEEQRLLKMLLEDSED